MSDLTREFAGAERTFRLHVGQIMDLEEACQKTGIGEIYRRVGTGTYFLREVKNVVKQGLIGGGMNAAEADRLVVERLNEGAMPLVEFQALAVDILLCRFANIPTDESSSDSQGDGVSKPLDVGALFSSFVKAGIPPQVVRDMDYKDFVAILQAAGSDKVQAPSDDEFDALVADWESRQGAD